MIGLFNPWSNLLSANLNVRTEQQPIFKVIQISVPDHIYFTSAQQAWAHVLESLHSEQQDQTYIFLDVSSGSKVLPGGNASVWDFEVIHLTEKSHLKIKISYGIHDDPPSLSVLKTSYPLLFGDLYRRVQLGQLSPRYLEAAWEGYLRNVTPLPFLEKKDSVVIAQHQDYLWHLSHFDHQLSFKKVLGAWSWVLKSKTNDDDVHDLNKKSIVCVSA